MKAYKLVRKAKDGQLYPLFIDKAHPWAPHLKTKLASGQKRVWIECEVDDYTTYDRPESQGGAWILANQLTVIRELTFEEVERIVA